ncbi:hypothetical protein EGT71_03435 [Atlantibacter subterranea]|uniref:Uncharacterized protein n=1 Tax=Atlantibacter subterraneus TaxID=255519 RepID=A0A427V6P7_9ENTR|nr:hypothetical protein EGK67_01465 [Atlantibacter subterranea]RSE08650.1 hypothetical protein EGT84_01715 [Atlantibacter subterranea]RSE28451.1 hypothetical protein EGT71_03435 [Atlantibacter subterranea]
MNQNGGVDGLHKLGTSKKSSGTNSDCGCLQKFAPKLKKSQKFLTSYQPRPGQMMTISVPANVNKTLAIA